MIRRLDISHDACLLTTSHLTKKMANEITITGLDSVLNKLEKFGQAVKNLSPAFDDIEPLIIQEFTANFPGKGEVLEHSWPERKYSYPWPMLIKTGTMQSNWTSTKSPKELKIKNPTDYATYHHFGTPKLPVRKLVYGSANIKEIAKTRITAHLKKALL